MKRWLKQRTTRAGLAGLLVAAAGALTGELTITQAAIAGFSGLIGLLAGDHDQTAK